MPLMTKKKVCHRYQQDSGSDSTSFPVRRESGSGLPDLQKATLAMIKVDLNNNIGLFYFVLAEVESEPEILLGLEWCF